jgi:hypothetical protein
MNELQTAVSERLQWLTWLRVSWLHNRKNNKTFAKELQVRQSDLFHSAEAAGIINQWKRIGRTKKKL